MQYQLEIADPKAYDFAVIGRLRNVNYTMPPKKQSSHEVLAIDPTVLSAALIETFKSKSLIDALVPALTEAITDAVSKNIHEAMQLEFVKRDEKVNQLSSKVSHLEHRLDDFEQYSRRNSLIVYGIPEEEQENTDKKIIEAAKQHLNVDILATAIDRTHRLGAKTDRTGESRTRPIIVKFNSYNIRAVFYRARAGFKGRNIFVRKSLTPERQRWLKQARNHPSSVKAWTQDGRIEVRMKDNAKLIINSENDLKKLSRGK